jgi:hypothetical protein
MHGWAHEDRFVPGFCEKPPITKKVTMQEEDVPDAQGLKIKTRGSFASSSVSYLYIFEGPRESDGGLYAVVYGIDSGKVEEVKT